MNFRYRLILFLVVTLVAVQALTAFFAYTYLRADTVERGKRDLAAAMQVFRNQVTFLADRADEGVRVLSLDYALRAAVAQNDHDTELSALRNHGNRIGAARMMLIGLDGTVKADTAAQGREGHRFQFAQLLRSAELAGQGTGLASLGGRIYWIVAVPVKAPVTIAFIAAYLPVDSAMLRKVQAATAQRHSVVLATLAPDGRWEPAVRDRVPYRDIEFPAAHRIAGASSRIERHGGREYLIAVAPMATTQGSAPVIAILGLSLDEALAAYRSVLFPMLGILLLALLVATGGAMLIVRQASRPIEALAGAAKRIALGDYTPPPRIAQRDEIGHLSDALINMTRSIADREADLTRAVEDTEIARAEAVRANEAKSQFLANMSHELRTPLNAIVGFSEMIAQEVLGPLGVARYRDYAKDIHDSGRHLLGQVERMLDLAESEAGKLALVNEHASPGVLLIESVAQLRPFAQKMGVTMTVDRDVSDWPQMTCDPARLRLALVNIVHNAIKFTPKGGAVSIAARLLPGAFSISVRDTGIGIEPELLGIVTRPFHRLKSALDGQHQGAGLGLPFARVVIELHGGSLHLQSTPGEGTTVTVELPAAVRELKKAG